MNHSHSFRPLSILSVLCGVLALLGKGTHVVANPTDSPATTPSPSESRLIFCNYEKIFTIRPDGTRRRTLISRQFVASPTISSDGKRFAYDYYRTDLGIAETIIAPTDDEGPTVVLAKRTKGVMYMFPVISPDGKSVITQRRHLGSKGEINWTERLVLVGVGGVRRDLGPDTLFTDVYRFDPDGQSVLFAKARATGLFRISVMGGYEGAAQHIPIAREIYEFDISSDGRRVVFTSPEKGELKGLYVCDIEGNGLQRLPLPTAKYRSPTWSPDGKSIAFTYARGANPPGIRIVDADGKHVRILTRDETAAGPFWR